MSRRVLWVTAVCAGLACGPAPAQGPSLPGPDALGDLLDRFDVPGIAVATVTQCQPMPVVTAGLARRAPDIPVTETTVFEAASLSKPVFAYLVMQLVDEGVIDLDAPLADTPAATRVLDHDAYAALTPRLVLTHRTGLPNWAENRSGPLHFVHAPDTEYSYSGEAFELLRAHVEEVTGQTLDQLFRDRLGAVMPLSGFAPPLAAAATPSRGYAALGAGRALSYRGGSAGGLLTTAADYAAFLGMVCRGDGLSEATHAEMLRPQVDAPGAGYPGPVSRSLGWAILQTEGDTIVLHDGNNDEYRSFAAVLPAYGEGYVFLTNGARGGQMIGVLLDALTP